MMRALCVGECMVELRAIDDSTMRVGHAGDTYNTAVYLRRTAAALGVEINVGYLTGLGTDEFSTEMRQAWKREGVEDRSIEIDGSLPGLYRPIPSPRPPRAPVGRLSSVGRWATSLPSTPTINECAGCCSRISRRGTCGRC